MRYEIVLQPMPQPEDGGICVGTAGGETLVYHGREATVGGRPVAHEEIADALYAAIDVACNKLWGPEWPSALALVGRIGRRNTSKDRVHGRGLPAQALRLIANASAGRHARLRGDMLVAVARHDILSAPNPDGGPPVKGTRHDWIDEAWKIWRAYRVSPLMTASNRQVKDTPS